VLLYRLSYFGTFLGTYVTAKEELNDYESHEKLIRPVVGGGWFLCRLIRCSVTASSSTRMALKALLGDAQGASTIPVGRLIVHLVEGCAEL
jgi:hypothetical protein